MYIHLYYAVHKSLCTSPRMHMPLTHDRKTAPINGNHSLPASCRPCRRAYPPSVCRVYPIFYPRCRLPKKIKPLATSGACAVRIQMIRSRYVYTFFLFDCVLNVVEELESIVESIGVRVRSICAPERFNRFVFVCEFECTRAFHC